jgi:uncharacterized protein YdhG (YjbR/CyaY superfamily)
MDVLAERAHPDPQMEKRQLMKKYDSVEEYIAAMPAEARGKLQSLRKTIRQAAPKAEEVISYNMPAFRHNSMLVWYGAHTQHIGFYPRTSAMAAFRDDLTAYKTSKGAIQFPIDKPIPAALVKKIVKFRLDENARKKR